MTGSVNSIPCEQLERAPEVAGRSGVGHHRVERIAEDGQPQRVHVDAQLMGLPGARQQAVATAPGAVLQQLDPAHRVGLATTSRAVSTPRSLTIRLRTVRGRDTPGA